MYPGHQTPPQETSSRRQNARLGSKAGETRLKREASKLAKGARRRRVEIRRIRSVSQAKSAADPSRSSRNDVCLKKKRDEIQKETIEGTSVDLAPEDGAVIRGAWGSTVRCRPYGNISVVGRRREMKDVVAVELGFLKKGEESYDFFGVYVGHGGWRVAHACGQMLHKMLAKIVEEESSDEIDWEEVMAAGFNKMDAEVNKKGADVATMGSTAVVVVVGDNEVVVANCGGPRVVLSRGGVTVQLLDDHKPDKGDVLERIEVRGGDVINWNGQRVHATSGSINSDDHYLSPYVIAEPEVRVMSRSHGDEFLIMGSDGFWDVISNELACQVARRYFEITCESESGGGAEAAAALLAELAMGGGSRDNISNIVVDLRGTYGQSNGISSSTTD